MSEIPFASGEPGPLLTALCCGDSKRGPELGQSCGTSPMNTGEQQATYFFIFCPLTARGICFVCAVCGTNQRDHSRTLFLYFFQSRRFIYHLSGCVSCHKTRSWRVAVKPRQTFKCLITGSDLCRQGCTFSGELARTCPTSAPTLMRTHARVYRLLNRDRWNSRTSARG